MSEKGWKRAERGIANLLGGRRNPVNGRGNSADVGHSRFAIEVKQRADFPAYLEHGLQQAETAARGSNLTPLVVFHVSGSHYESSYVVLRLGSFRKFLVEQDEQAMADYLSISRVEWGDDSKV